MQAEPKQIIWQMVASIPAGRVATYGQIASLCGYPGYARYVGQTLKQLPKGSLLPWHRVVNAKGEISFPVDSAGYQQQKQRLEKEGVIFSQHKIDLKVFAWNGAANETEAET
jgi:methylated-DNA-protein-cysteine methyltransferase-like protein